MNALQPTLTIDMPMTRRVCASGIRHPVVTMTDSVLELTLPDGWILRDGTRSQLCVVRGCLWLTDTHGTDLWLKDNENQTLTTDTLITAERETVIQLTPATAWKHAWQPRLQMNAMKRRVHLQHTAPSFLQRCLQMFQSP